MAQPLPYERDYDFTSFQVRHATTPPPGNKLDAEFDQIGATIEEVLSRIAILQRDDLQLANSLVGYDQLKPELRNGFTTPTVWTTATKYPIGASIYVGPKVYAALAAHTSGVFAADLSAGKWHLLADFTIVAGAVQSAVDAAAAAVGSATEAAASAFTAATAAMNAQALLDTIDVDDVTTLAAISADITAAVANAADISTVAGVVSDIPAVAGIAADVTTVGGIAADVTAAAANMAAIIAAPDAAEAAAESAQAAADIAATLAGAVALIGTALQPDDILDEDDFASDSATKVPSQQSVKAYVDANSVGTSTTVAVSAHTTLTAANRDQLINVNAAAAARTITLPTVAAAGDGFTVSIRNSAATNFVTVQAAGAELIDGVSTFKMTLTGHMAVFRCNGLSWNVVAEAGTLEVGSNANGSYEKHANGKLVCTGFGPGVACTSTSTATGSLFFGDETWTLPHACISTPYIAFARAQITNRWLNTRGINLSTIVIRHFAAATDASVITAHVQAEGRWY